MPKIKFHIPKTEILFVIASSRDTKGRRVLVRCEGVENTIYKDDMNDETLALIGIGTQELKQIQQFFSGR